ncbi:sensor histidine kinase [Brevibacterium senegalense]|uniref:sensor histidine kinase n=1 Tax=Brevibacterium senegalense TaxID=1033736 RepID=UPI0003049F53|nr:ATP-binding protein [Brevibacterium senegalense]
MSDSSLSASTVARALQWCLHGLIVGLGVLVVVRALEGDALDPALAIGLVLAFEVVYALGAVQLGRRARPERSATPPERSGTRPERSGTRTQRSGDRAALIWLALLTLLWIGTTVLAPDAAFLVFPLFFLVLHLLPDWWGPVGVFALALIAIAALAAHRGLSVGGVTGPLVGAGVAVAIGVGVRTLVREVHAREQLVDRLLAAQAQLAETERAAGVETERTRMAAELHDTVAQSLSSIQLLLSAAERRLDDDSRTEDSARPDAAHPEAARTVDDGSHPDSARPADAPGRREIALAKESAGAALAETRAFIRALSSPALAAATLPDALARIVAEADTAAEAAVAFRSQGTARSLPRSVDTTILRVVQGALGNAVAHAHGQTVTVTLTYETGRAMVEIADDGRGFDPGAVRPSAESDSFGLDVMRGRVAAVGGTLRVDSRPGEGTRVSAVFRDVDTTDSATADGGGGATAIDDATTDDVTADDETAKGSAER